jgi:hypothetical protein
MTTRGRKSDLASKREKLLKHGVAYGGHGGSLPGMELPEHLGPGELAPPTSARAISIYVEDEPQVKFQTYDTYTGELIFARCLKDSAIDLAGVFETGKDGRASWKLTNFICVGRDFRVVVNWPASFVATPISESPVYLTTSISFPGLSDLLVEVFSWNSSGKLAPLIAFSWRCRVRYEEIIG